MTSQYIVRPAVRASDLQGAYKVRMQVFSDEQGFPPDTEVDNWDPISAHFVLVSSSDDAVLGTVRFVPYPPPIENSTIPVSSHSADEPLGAVRGEEAVIDSFLATAGEGASDGSLGAKLGRLALVKSARGTGLGAKIVQDAETWLLEKFKQRSADAGVSSAVMRASSQMQVISFYKRFGYVAQGEPYDEDGAPHTLVVKTVQLH